MSTQHDSAADAYLETIVERSVAPYRGLVAPDVLALMREMVVELLKEDEVGRDLLERARPSQVPLQSGERAGEGVAEPGHERKSGGKYG